MKTVGFIGVGLMGSSMVRNLMKHGFSVRIYARHPEKVSEVTAEGAVLCPSIAECVRGCDAVITMPAPRDWICTYCCSQSRLVLPEAGSSICWAARSLTAILHPVSTSSILLRI